MSNFFEQELRKLFGDGKIISDPTYSGRACFGTLGRDLRARAQFVTSGYADHYDSLKITVLNRMDGPVDTLMLKLKDLLGMKSVPGNPNFRNGVSPYIWVYQGKAEWYAYHPTAADYKTIQQAAEQYLGVFRERQQEHTQGSPKLPKLVYICTPLQGDMAKNIEFAQQKATEVFQNGSIPLSPLLMFAAPKDPTQSQTVQEMGLRLIESCNEVHVYGPEWTEEMWKDIRHAMELGIDVMTDQKTIGRTQPHRQSARKGKER